MHLYLQVHNRNVVLICNKFHTSFVNKIHKKNITFNVTITRLFIALKK